MRPEDVELLLSSSGGRPNRRLARVVGVVLLLTGGFAIASVHSQLAAYRGYLERDGVPVSTPQSFSFRLEYGDGGMAWSESPLMLPVSSGHFEVALGDSPANSIPAAVFADPFVLLTVSVGGVPLVGKQRLLTVPYAARALDSWRALDATRAVDATNATNAVNATSALASARVVQGVDGGSRTTVDGLYCGSTATTSGSFTAQGGALIGVRAAKSLCEQACTSPTAHMCETREAMRSYELGGDPPGGWVKGNWGVVYQASQSTDCQGWTTGTSPIGSWNYLGTYYCPPGGICGGPSGWISNDYCGNSHPMLCCD